MARAYRQAHFPRLDSPNFRRFDALWIVEGDPSYRVQHQQGFLRPGLFLTWEGCGELAVAGGSGAPELPLSALVPGSMVCVPPGAANRYACPPDGTWRFHFYYFVDEGLMTTLGLRWNEIQHLDNISDLVPRGEDIAGEMLAQRPGFDLRVEGLFTDLMVQVSRGRSDGEPWRRGVEATLTWIGRHLDRTPDMERLTRLSGLGRTRFFQCFREVTGRTPLQYALERKLDSALLMLETTDKPLKEIAAALALYDEFHLSRLFRRQFGVPPARWRREHRVQ